MPVGKLTLILGTMFGGKTEELYNLANTLNIHIKKKILFFVPDKNNQRDGENILKSHRGTRFCVRNIKCPEEIIALIEGNVHAVFIDEAQFFDEKSLANIVLGLLLNHYNVYVAGLDSDFQGKPFTSITSLFPYAHKVIRKNSICTFLNDDETLCGNDAVFNQRLTLEGNVATYGKQIEVGAEEKYAPRCWEHFVWPEDIAVTTAKIPSCESINGKTAKDYKEIQIVHYY